MTERDFPFVIREFNVEVQQNMVAFAPLGARCL
jgi:hypothetical protein